MTTKERLHELVGALGIVDASLVALAERHNAREIATELALGFMS